MPVSPAPWVVVIARDGDMYVCSAGPRPAPVVAVMEENNKNNEEDAPLIAAAPELFEALYELVQYTPFPLHNQLQVAAFHKALSALSKANGGRPLVEALVEKVSRVRCVCLDRPGFDGLGRPCKLCDGSGWNPGPVPVELS